MTSCAGLHVTCQVGIEVLFVSVREGLCGPFQSSASKCTKSISSLGVIKALKSIITCVKSAKVCHISLLCRHLIHSTGSRRTSG